MDCRCAEEMGWRDIQPYWFNGELMGFDPTGYYTEVPRFSADVGDAWIIVEHIRDRGTNAELAHFLECMRIVG